MDHGESPYRAIKDDPIPVVDLDMLEERAEFYDDVLGNEIDPDKARRVGYMAANAVEDLAYWSARVASQEAVDRPGC